MKLLFAAFFLFSVSAYSMDPAQLEMLKSMKVDKGQISMAIDQLQQMGRITPEQAAQAKKELGKLNDKDMDRYNEMAKEKIANGDAKRLMNHDYTKSSPSLDPSSPVENREPSSEAAPSADPVKIDFSKLGQ